jgi:hypothetical protein
VLAVAERALAPLDAVRSVTLRAVGRRGRVLFASRDARVLMYATLSTSVTLAVAVLAPLWLLAVGPLVLGVPHLVADVRYLVARPGLHRRRGLVLLVGAPLAATWIWPSPALALTAVIAVAMVARGSLVRRALVLVAGAAAAGAAWTWGHGAALLLAHAHNAVALLVWWLVARRGRLHVVPLVLAAAGTLLLLFVLPVSGTPNELVRSLSPSGSMQIAAAFAFLQATHYLVWLRLVPEDARERAGIRSFSATLRALVRDLGGWLVAGAVLAAVAVLAYGAVDADAARTTYLRVAYFHGFLELAVLALLAIEGAQLLRAQRESAA